MENGEKWRPVIGWENYNARNLEWCTQFENLAHMTKSGRRAAPWKGKRSPAANLTDGQAAAIRKEYSKGGTSYAALGKKYGTSKRTVGRIINNIYYAAASTTPTREGHDDG